MIAKINETVSFLHKEGIKDPEVGIILGTGLGSKFIKSFDVQREIAYSKIPNFPVATVEFHKGKLLFGELNGKKIIAMQGRFHYYEGYSMQQITFPVRVMKALGIKNLLISNAAGNMNLTWSKGDLMLIDDHINLQPENPLRGKNEDSLGPRFPDMSAPYDPRLNELLVKIAADKQIVLNKGVYVAVSGPNLETRAEYRFLKLIGADVVGMSTVPEVIVAKHMNLPVCAVSVLTDDCNPDDLLPANIDEIIAIAGKAEIKLTTLFVELINQL